MESFTFLTVVLLWRRQPLYNIKKIIQSDGALHAKFNYYWLRAKVDWYYALKKCKFQTSAVITLNFRNEQAYWWRFINPGATTSNPIKHWPFSPKTHYNPCSSNSKLSCASIVLFYTIKNKTAHASGGWIVTNCSPDL